MSTRKSKSFTQKRKPSTRGSLVNKKQMRQMIISTMRKEVEKKYIDLVLSAQTISTTMSISLLNGITQGAGATNRIGAQLDMLKVQWKLQFVGADATNYIRMLLILDRQPNGATFAAADLLQNSTDPFSFFFMDNIARFKVLADKAIDVTLTGPDAVHTSGTVLLGKGINSFYTGAGNTIANIKTNALFIVFISDSGAVSHPTVNGDVRLLYVDS